MKRCAWTIAAVLALAVAAPATASAPGPLVGAGAKVAGRGYPQWERAWVKWRLALPIHATSSQHRCITRDQHGAVWFLDGNGNQPERVTRHCTIPAGAHVLLGLWIICTNIDPSPLYHADTAHGLVRCARRAFKRSFSGYALVLDGKRLSPSAHRTSTPAFRFHMPARHNMLGLRGHTHGRAAVRSATALLAPLPAGTHTLKVTERYPGYTRRVTWKLTVAAAATPGGGQSPAS